MGLAASFKIPGAFITAIFGAGTQSPLNAPRTVVGVDYGTAGPLNTATPIASADEAAQTYGAGSHLHLFARAFFEEFTYGTLYLIRYAEALGGVAAAKRLDVTGNAVTGGSLFLDINGLTPIEIPVNIGDSTATQLAAAVAALNVRTEYPCSAAFTGTATDVGGVSFVANQTNVRVQILTPTTGPTAAAVVGVAQKDITVTLKWTGTPVDIGAVNAGVKYTANQPGVRVRHVDPAAVQPASAVTVNAKDITVTLKNTGGNAVDATADEVRAAVAANANAMALLAAVANTGDGTGTAVTAGFTALTGAHSSTCDEVRAAVAASANAMALLSSVANTTPPGNALCVATAFTNIAQAYATFTWKQKGARGNQFKLRTSASGITGSSYTVTDTVSGATDGNPTAALDSLINADYDYIATGVNTSDANTGLLPFVQHINDRAGPFIGLRGVGIAASIDTYGASIALSLALNAHRMQLGWCRAADMTTVEIAAKLAAIRAQAEGVDPASNLDYQQFAKFRGPFVNADKISVIEANNALNNGLTPIGINRGAAAYIWRSITTRYQDAQGAPDYRTLDTSKVAVVDYIADFLAQDYGVKGFQQMKARADSGDQRPQYKVLTPQIVKDWILTILYGAQNKDPVMLENVEANAPLLSVELSAVVPGRFVARVPLDVIEGAHQFDITLYQIG